MTVRVRVRVSYQGFVLDAVEGKALGVESCLVCLRPLSFGLPNTPDPRPEL